MAQFTESQLCNKQLCENKIFSTRDHSLAMQALKKKILSEGIANFETDPRFVRLMRCKKTVDETYYNEQTCKSIYGPPKPPTNFQAPPYRPSQAPPYRPSQAPPPQAPQAPPFDPRTWGAPPKQRPKKACAEGKIRNPSTGRCINDPTKKATKKATAPDSDASFHPSYTKQAKTKKAPPAKTQKACPAGKIRNPSTGRCINDPALKAKTRKATPPKKACPAGKIRNPLTGRCINDPALKK
jgi:hypothetical protein